MLSFLACSYIFVTTYLPSFITNKAIPNRKFQNTGAKNHPTEPFLLFSEQLSSFALMDSSR